MIAPDTFQCLGEIATSQHLADGMGCKLLAFIQDVSLSNYQLQQAGDAFLGARMSAEQTLDPVRR